MLLRVLERADRGHDVGHQGLFGAAVTEIGGDRLGEGVLVIDQQGDGPVDPVAPHAHRLGHGRSEAGALPVEHGLHAGDFGLGHGGSSSFGLLPF